jgi:hypothetical protein
MTARIEHDPEKWRPVFPKKIMLDQTAAREKAGYVETRSLLGSAHGDGEGANWLTIGTTIRFPVEGAPPEHKRTGHL